MTTQEKHTPGPWYVRLGGNFIDVGTSPEPKRGKGSGNICQLDVHFPFKIPARTAADAHLIAAAPELLAALKETLRHVSTRTKDRTHLRNALAAIAKAQGQS